MTTALAVPLADSWGMHGDVGAGWMIVMGAAMVLFWGAVLIGLVWLIRGLAGGWPASGATAVSRESPVEILDRRFAEGTISTEDYQARREVLINGRAETSGPQTEAALRAPPGQEEGQ